MTLIRFILGKLLLLLNALTLPSPIHRSETDQTRLDQQTRKFALYQFEGCPFCIKVRRAIRRLNLKIELRDAQKPGLYREELTREGGMYQTPCLKIPQADGKSQWLYESDDIIAFLERTAASS